MFTNMKVQSYDKHMLIILNMGIEYLYNFISNVLTDMTETA